MLDPDVARDIRRSMGKHNPALEYTTRSAVLEPALAHAIRTAPKMRDCGYAVPPARPGREFGECLIRDSLILMAVEQMKQDLPSLRARCREIARGVNALNLSADGVMKAYYRARLRHPI